MSLKNWLVHFMNTESGWIVSQVHVVAEDAETAAEAAAKKFGINLENEPSVKAITQDFTDVMGVPDQPQTVKAEPEPEPEPEPVDGPLNGPLKDPLPVTPVITDLTEPAPAAAPEPEPERLLQDVEHAADNAWHEVESNPAAAEVSKALAGLSPEAAQLLKDLFK